MKIKAELDFPAELKEEPILCNLCKKFPIIMSIIEASFSTDLGWAILVFEGSEEDLKESFDYLKSRGVEIKETQTLQH